MVRRNDGRSIAAEGRRTVLGAGLLLAGAAVLFARAPASASLLPATPRQSEGPFYPDRLPLDRDADLLQVAGVEHPAQGIPLHLFGRVLDRDGRPLREARVEIWQCDAFGAYHNAGDPRAKRAAGFDPAFQGYGRSVTDGEGAYRFRTIRPVPYATRTPHIHFKVEAADGRALTTQMYIEGEPMNQSDFLFRRSGAAGKRLLVALKPAPQLDEGALTGTFEIVLG